MLKNAEALQRVFDLRIGTNKAAEDKAAQVAELEVGQSLTIVPDLILNASTILFDALGASATLKANGLGAMEGRCGLSVPNLLIIGYPHICLSGVAKTHRSKSNIATHQTPNKKAT